MINKHCRHPSILKIRENISRDSVFDFQCIHAPDIMQIIKDFDAKKAKGYDVVPMQLLQKSAPYIAPYIAKLVNNSFIKGVFPGDLKLAEVSSLFLKKKALNKMNYRPVSILIALSKVYKKAMSLQISDYFSNIFSALFSAFRKGYSCQSTLLNMIENLKCALDRGEFIACISMDISKAFDCLPHCLTICKLHAYGLSRNACTLIASYLYKRKQRVKIGSLKSDWKEKSKGVPHGSILGPLIFNVFMNDIFYFVKNANLFNYADDNSVSVNGKELSMLSHLLQSEAVGSLRMQWKLIPVNFREFFSREINRPRFQCVCWRKRYWASSTGLTAVSKFKPRLPAQWAFGTHRKGPSRMEKVTSRMNRPIRNSTQIRNSI